MTTREELEELEQQGLLDDAVDLALLVEEKAATIATLRALLRESAEKCGFCDEPATWERQSGDSPWYACDIHVATATRYYEPFDLGRRIRAELDKLE